MVRSIGLAVLFCFFLIFVAVPLGTLLVCAFTGKPPRILESISGFQASAFVQDVVQNATLEHIADLWEIRRYRRAAKNTLALSVLVATLTSLLALPISLSFGRSLMSRRSLLGLVVVLPLTMHA